MPKRYACEVVQTLESRALLATSSTAFTPPDLTSYIEQAESGVNTGPATIRSMLDSLQGQATLGPLADFKSGAVNGTQFVTEVTSLVASFQSNVDTQLSPQFPNIDKILKAEGDSLVAAVTAANTQATNGVTSSSQLASSFAAAINSLTGGPLLALNTPISGYQQATTSLETQLKDLANGLSTTATTPLSASTVQTVANADVAAYKAAIDASLAVYPNVAQQVDSAITALSNAIASLPQSSVPQTYLTQAVTTFDSSLLGSGGVFNSNSAFGRFLGTKR